jgi:hypothetical protein
MCVHAPRFTASPINPTFRPSEAQSEMNKEQELQRYLTLMREAEERKDEIGITNLKREINRLLGRDPDTSLKDTSDKQ